MNKNELAKKYALIDLHLHLDGSMTAIDIVNMAKLGGVKLDTYNEQEISKQLTVSKDCKDLNDYLRCFELPLSVMQNRESIEYAVYSLIDRLYMQGLLYAEIRFAPQLHTKGGLTQDEVVVAALSGRSKWLREHYAGNFKWNFRVNIILCCMRGFDNRKANMETVEIAEMYIGTGIVALDLAGAEGMFPTEKYADVFAQARKYDVPFTIHAGEAAGVSSMIKALDFGATRIGHGIRSYNDMVMKKIAAGKGIAYEMCPTSNIQTKAVAEIDSIEKYPIEEFLDEGIRVTINTDNMTVSNTTLENEFAELFKKESFNEEYAKKIVLNSAKAAFLDDEDKRKLVEACEEKIL